MVEDDRPEFADFIYGTAWKERATVELTRAAVQAGFRAIDTANQPRHYREDLVGEALKALASDGIPRNALILQTKFTPLHGHDDRIPYDPRADLEAQVRQSFESSLKNLGTEYLDSYLLHGPYSRFGLGREDWEVWKAIEEIHRSGGARMIGVSNVNARQLSTLVERAAVKPMVVQNRCFASRGWDREVRRLCAERGIAYQAFSLLTANPFVLRHPEVESIAARRGVQPEQVVFRFALDVGMLPLTGTTNLKHMRADLRVLGMRLAPEEVAFIDGIAG